MEDKLAAIHIYLFMGISTLYLFQSFILFIRSKNNKARKTLAVLELLWGLVYLSTMILMLTVIKSNEYSLLREKVLVVGNFFIMITHFFPIQVLLPGWLNWKKGTLLLLPIILLTTTYYGGMSLLGESPECLSTYNMVWQSIGHFNVWFRFVMMLSNIIYIAIILYWLYKFEKRYIKWKNENFADQEYVDISWMRSYDYIVVGIFTLYMGILLLGGRIPVFIHSIFAVSGFSYLFYKALFYKSPYPEDFFSETSPTITENPNSEEYVLPISAGNHLEAPSEQTFENNIQTYTQQLKTWLEEEKPYLYNDFKLTDVSRILPLNRSYLSRVFNEGFGKNFSEVVRSYRINHSKTILRKNATLPVYKVAKLCGFRSDTTYLKAFKQITGLTPTQYRAQFKKE